MFQGWRWKVLANIKSKQMYFINKIENATLKVHPQYQGYDMYAACYLLNHARFVTHTQKLYASVEYMGQLTKGVLLVDYYNITGKQPNTNIVTNVNVTVLQDTMVKTLS